MVLSVVSRVLGFDFEAAIASSSHRMSRFHKTKIVGLIAVLVLVWVAQTYDRSLVFVLAREHPLVLVALEARAHNFVLAADRVATLPLVVVATVSRFVDHFLYYLLGRWAGEPTFRVLRQRSGHVARLVRRAEEWFARTANLAVLVLSDRPVCVLAGASMMSPARFACLHLLGTFGRVWAAVVFAKSSSHVLKPWLTRLEDHTNSLTVLTVAGTALWIAFLAYRGRRRVPEVDEHESDGRASGDPPPA